MKIEYSISVLALGLAYGILTQLLPDFPITQEILLALVIWALAKLGVEVTAPAVRGFLIKRGIIVDDYSRYEVNGAIDDE